MDTVVDVLRRRWLRLCASIGVVESLAATEAEVLVAAYAEPHRAYHGPAHLIECFAVTDAMGDLGADERSVVELALWFHDAIYDPRAADNEARSAAMAHAWLHASGLDSWADEVSSLIEMTAGHAELSGTAASAAVHDADLAILGSSTERYDEYADQIRREYAHVSNADFAAGRARVIAAFLDAPVIYARTDVRSDREAQARANMRRELEALEGPKPSA